MLALSLKNVVLVSIVVMSLTTGLGVAFLGDEGGAANLSEPVLSVSVGGAAGALDDDELFAYLGTLPDELVSESENSRTLGLLRDHPQSEEVWDRWQAILGVEDPQSWEEYLAELDTSVEFKERLLEWLDGETFNEAQARLGSAVDLLNQFRDALGSDAARFDEQFLSALVLLAVTACPAEQRQEARSELTKQLEFERGFGEYYADWISSSITGDFGDLSDIGNCASEDAK